MVNLKDVRASNAALKTTVSNEVAVFVGATSGIGETTLRNFAKSSSKPKVYLVGRSESAASRILGELKELNPEGIFTFIKSDVSLLKNVDALTDEIKTKEKKIDLLFLTPGYVSFGGREGEFHSQSPQ
jgi:NADP-dependent 3-hydroxy acid dehydrogenase YdfG